MQARRFRELSASRSCETDIDYIIVQNRERTKGSRIAMALTAEEDAAVYKKHGFKLPYTPFSVIATGIEIYSFKKKKKYLIPPV